MRQGDTFSSAVIPVEEGILYLTLPLLRFLNRGNERCVKKRGGKRNRRGERKSTVMEGETEVKEI